MNSVSKRKKDSSGWKGSHSGGLRRSIKNIYKCIDSETGKTSSVVYLRAEPKELNHNEYEWIDE